MKLLKTILFVVLVAASLMFTCFATEDIVIEDVKFEVFVDANGVEDEDVVNVRVKFSVPESVSQVAVFLVSEDIDELNEQTKSKVIFMNQSVNPDDGEYVFPIEKSRIASATGLEEIDGVTLYLKLGGKTMSETKTQSVVYSEEGLTTVISGDVDGDGMITSRDATMLLRYLAGWQLSGISTSAMDVDKDGEVTNRDGTLLLRYLAGWNVELL